MEPNTMTSTLNTTAAVHVSVTRPTTWVPHRWQQICQTLHQTPSDSASWLHAGRCSVSKNAAPVGRTDTGLRRAHTPCPHYCQPCRAALTAAAAAALAAPLAFACFRRGVKLLCRCSIPYHAASQDCNWVQREQQSLGLRAASSGKGAMTAKAAGSMKKMLYEADPL